jgi:adenylate cyclase
MFTDTVGFTASTQTDESHALDLLRQQQDIVSPLISSHHGREIKSTGDGFLVEFDSALKAIQCAIDIQRRINDRNAEGSLPPIRIRIGIHLGDVVQSGTDILGDAVNVAARIEPVSEPGGICVSGAVREQVWNKIPEKLEKLPPTHLKGVQSPMDIYRVVLSWTVKEPASRRSGPPRLAVLPFVNISPDPNDEYFADGLTEEMITVLSQLQELRVIARTSVSLYKSTHKSVSQIGGELGVDAILEGSVRKSGDQLRITAQLVNVETQEHTWAHTYDRKLENVFAVQTQIAKRVARQLKINLRAADQSRLEARPAVRSDSYLAYLKGKTLLHTFTSAVSRSLESAVEQFELAISLDPKNAAAYSGLADATRMKGWWHPDVPRSKWEETSRRLVTRAIELDPNLAEAHASLALDLWDSCDYPAAEKELKLALLLNPSYSLAHNAYAAVLEDQARVDEALLQFKLGEEADPLWLLNVYNSVLLLIWLGRFDDALPKIQKIRHLDTSLEPYHFVLANYHLARSDLARCLDELRQAIELNQEPREREVTRAWYFALSGEFEEARAVLRREETLHEFGESMSEIALVYAELGDLDECFRMLEKAISTGPLAFQRWRLDPRLKEVRSDPRFAVMLKKLNLA